jgi:hypothetical protein
VDLLYLSYHQIRCKPQAGTWCELSWAQLAAWLSSPVRSVEKTGHGGYSPARYRDNIRHLDKLEQIWALVVDVDVEGDTNKIALAVEGYSCIIHETFTSTVSQPRCRLLVELAKPTDARTYAAAHQQFLKDLKKKHVHADEKATDASRLSYCPVRPPGSPYQFRTTQGLPLDTSKLTEAVWTRPVTNIRVPKHPDEKIGVAKVSKQYVESAVASAVHNISVAHEGARHATLIREALSLSRSELGLSLEDIERHLFSPALQRMGVNRTHEIRAAIQSGFEKMRQRSG